jgi:hypothetical protein
MMAGFGQGFALALSAIAFAGDRNGWLANSKYVQRSLDLSWRCVAQQCLRECVD